MSAVDEIDDPAELTELVPMWDELLARTPGASFLHSLDWLEVYWKHFGAGKRLRALVVREGHGVSGILPLVVRVSRRAPRLALHRARLGRPMRGRRGRGITASNP